MILDLLEKLLLDVIGSDKKLLSKFKLWYTCRKLCYFYFYSEVRVKNQ